MPNDEYISIRRAAKMVGLTEKQLLSMLHVQIGPVKLRYKEEGDQILIERDSLTELFLGYTGGWE